MTRITVITVGKIKEKFYSQAVDEYAKRLSRYCRLELVEVADEKTPDGAGENLVRQIKEREGGRILAKVPAGSWVIALAIEGEAVSSEQLAARLDRLAVGGQSQITMVIGGSLGLSKEVLERADWLLSFSRMTFPHQLMRVILLEQVYRSYRILAGEPYHK